MMCEDCVYWGSEYSEWEDSEGVFDTKRCAKAVQQWDAGDYSGDTYEFVVKPEFTDQLMFVKDGSDYRADLYTKADFFCAHFTSKAQGKRDE